MECVAVNKSLLVHVHVPKTAGSSFIRILEQNYGSDYFRYVSPDPAESLTQENLIDLINSRPNLRAIASHHVRVFPDELAGKRLLYVTFLRDPAKLFLSLLKFTRRHFSNLSPEIRAGWPDDTPHLSLRDLAAYRLNVTLRASQVCIQTRFFCDPRRTPIPVGYDFDHSGANCFSTAATILDRFFHVGIVEEFDASLAVLRIKLERLGLAFRFEPATVVNAVEASEEEVKWLHPDDPIGREVIARNANDYYLYERYRTKLKLEVEHLLKRWPEKILGWKKHRVPLDSKKSPNLGEIHRAIVEFGRWEYTRINLRRMEHLASLGLPWAGRSVWEVSAGVGNLSSFFLDRECQLTVTDIRQSLLDILRDRLPITPVRDYDLEKPPADFTGRFDIVFCYGCLYHTQAPDEVIARLAAHCRDRLVLETCVSRSNENNFELVQEDANALTQAFHGVGCRPSRRFLFAELSKHFAYVYVTASQPVHPEFPCNWEELKSGSGEVRSVFVASRTRLSDHRLLPFIPMQQTNETMPHPIQDHSPAA
jgi:2-polyprenyl-3-methyl-5-hydroxy-6-metoxy-1,4-benzoquinol methylase